MKTLDDIGYHDWTTIEQRGGDTPEGLKDLCSILMWTGTWYMRKFLPENYEPFFNRRNLKITCFIG